MGPPREDLLRPTLGEAGDEGLRMPYSPSSFFWVSFLGGPLAASVWFGINASRLGRLGRDAWRLGLAVAVGAAAVIAARLLPSVDPETFEWLRSSRNRRLATRGLGLLLWAGLRLRHTQPLRAAELSDQPFPSPWGWGIFVIVFSGVAAVMISLFVEGMIRGGLGG